MKLNNNSHQQAVWQNGGFGAFLETFVLVASSGIFSGFGKILKRKDEECYDIFFTNKIDITRLYNVMYYEGCICLKRKRDRFEL